MLRKDTTTTRNSADLSVRLDAVQKLLSPIFRCSSNEEYVLLGVQLLLERGSIFER